MLRKRQVKMRFPLKAMITGRRLHAIFLLSAALSLFVIIGLSCTTGSMKNMEPWLRSEKVLVWPHPPEPARIEHIGILNVDAFGGKGAILSFFTGKESSDLIKPIAIATNDAGLVVVVDTGRPMVHFFDLNTQKHWQVHPKYIHALQSPVDVAVTPDGQSFVSDSSRGEILIFNREGHLIDTFGKDMLSRPTGLALDVGSERLYVVDTIAAQIVVFSYAGKEIFRFSQRGAEPGELNYPTYAAILPNGSICVSDSLNFRVQIFKADGAFVRMFGGIGDGAGNFARPKGITTDKEGRIYVVDAAFENVQIFSDKGELLLAFGTSGDGLGEFSLPCGLFMDSSNRVWVADSFNQRIQAFRLLEVEQ